MMLKKYYNKCQKHVEKMFGKFRRFQEYFVFHSSNTHVLSWIFSPSRACMPVSSIYVWKQIKCSQLIIHAAYDLGVRDTLSFFLMIWYKPLS